MDEQLRDRLRVGISRQERQQLADLLLRMSANASCAINDLTEQSTQSTNDNQQNT